MVVKHDIVFLIYWEFSSHKYPTTSATFEKHEHKYYFN